jgi:hypothetical protein
MSSGDSLLLIFRHQHEQEDRVPMIAKPLKGSCMCCAQDVGGAICPNVVDILLRYGGAYDSGELSGCGTVYGGPFSPI